MTKHTLMIISKKILFGEGKIISQNKKIYLLFFYHPLIYPNMFCSFISKLIINEKNRKMALGRPLKKGSACPPNGERMRHSGVSGWYARLDRVNNNRPQQIQIWLNAWEESLRRGSPIAALLPELWPTLPATLLTNPGHVLDHLLARHDAELDGRSPRGAHPTPPRLADAIVCSEMLPIPAELTPIEKPPSLPLDALPPGFRAHLAKLNLPNKHQKSNSAVDDDINESIEKKYRTKTGIPLPVADPAAGGGLLAARLFKRHSEICMDWCEDEKIKDTRRLLSNMQIVDVSELVVSATKSRLYFELVRRELATLNEKEEKGKIGRKEAEKLLDKVVIQLDALQDEWPFGEPPRLIIANPPWLRIKDRFRGHPEGSHLRKALGETLRALTNEGNEKRFSTMRGNVNLYRLFIERSLQIIKPEGRLRVVVPDSLLREQSSAPLRQLLVEQHHWENIWVFDEGNCLFSGISQGVVVISVNCNGKTTSLRYIGPLDKADLRLDEKGLVKNAPSITLERERWCRWTRGEWGIPRLPREIDMRDELLKTIDDLSYKPRLAEPRGWLTADGETARVRVGEIDQTSNSTDIKPWSSEGKGVPFIRGVHFTDNGEGSVELRHPAFNKGIPSRASERQQARWVGEKRGKKGPRLACQAIVNAQQQRRLRWVVMPSGCVLGNSVNHIELPTTIRSQLINKYGTYKSGLKWLCNHLNDDDLDLWARAWAANNNVNNYELEMLPLDLIEMAEGSHIAA